MKNKPKHGPGVRLKNYELIKVVGSGGYGKVYHAFNLNTKEEVAIKCVPESTFQNHNGLVGFLHNQEKQLLKLHQSDHVIKYIDEFQQNHYSYIVMEYCNQGDIEKLWISNNKRFAEPEALVIFKQILAGMKDLHALNIMHRDIKLKNILLHNGKIKIGDLGFSKQLETEEFDDLCLGMLGYMAPEVVSSKPYSLEADIFSLGALLYLFLYGQLPFSDKNHQTFLNEAKKQSISHNETVSVPTQNLINSMLKYDRKERITWNALYLQQLN